MVEIDLDWKGPNALIARMFSLEARDARRECCYSWFLVNFLKGFKFK